MCVGTHTTLRAQGSAGSERQHGAYTQSKSHADVTYWGDSWGRMQNWLNM